MPMKDMGLKKKNQMKNSYMGGGKTSMMDKTMSNKDDVQKKFGGGGMTEPSMKKNK